MSFKVPNQYRLPVGGNGNNGAFRVPLKHGQTVLVIASDGMGWEHVSVSRKDRIPTWDEMCQIKAMFWDDDDCVMQLHPPRADWTNNHSKCLHLWRPIGAEIPRPDAIMVGIMEAGVLA